MKRLHAVRKFRARSFVGICLVLLIGCDDDPTGPVKNCDTLGGENLFRVLYFGEETPGNDAPNVGMPNTNIRLPQWYAESRVFVATSIRSDNSTVSGIFDVEMNPITYAFRNATPLKFPDVMIFGFDYDSVADEFLVTYSQAPGLMEVARAQRADSVLEVTDVVADNSWMPLGGRSTGDGTGAIVYGTDPETQVPGFYRITWNPSATDSLIFAVELGSLLTLSAGAGFDVWNNQIVFGITSGSFGAARTAILLLKTGTSDPPYVLPDLRGYFVAAAINPTGDCVAICHYVFSDGTVEPGDRLTIVSLKDGSATPVNVKVRPCTFPISDFVSWNPNGDALAVSAAGFTGEQAFYPRELWIRTAVPCH